MTGKGNSYIRRVAAGEYKPSRYSSPTRHWNSPNSPLSASPPRRPLTENELARKEEVRVQNNWIRTEQRAANMIRQALIKKVRLENEAKRIAAAIKKQKQQNNRLAAAAAVNLNNAKNLNEVFKNNKTILGRLRARLRR